MKERYGDIQVLARLKIFTAPELRQIVPESQKIDILKTFQESYGVYDSIAVFDIKGNVIVQTPGSPLKNHLNRSYIQEALRTQKAVISQPLISGTDGTFNIYTASIIKDSVSGKPIGFVRARIPVRYLERIVQGTIGKGREYYLINANQEIFIGGEEIYQTDQLSTGKVDQNLEKSQKKVTPKTFFPDLKLSPQTPTTQRVKNAKTAPLTSDETPEDMIILLFETEVEGCLQRLDSLLHKSDRRCLKEEYLLAAQELGGLGEMLDLKAFTSLCQSIQHHLETSEAEAIPLIAEAALKAWQRSQALVLLSQTENIPTTLSPLPITSDLEISGGTVSLPVFDEIEIFEDEDLSFLGNELAQSDPTESSIITLVTSGEVGAG